jgi:hypothetical protein
VRRGNILTLLPRSICLRCQPMAFMLLTAYILNRINRHKPIGKRL